MRNSGSGGGVATSSKVAQMASMFQTQQTHDSGQSSAPVVAPSVAHHRKPETLTTAAGRHVFPGTSVSSSSSSATSEVRRASKVTVHRTESHHERFSSARALFERMGSGDNLLEESRSSVVTSPSGSRTSSISHRPGSRGSDSESVVSSRHSANIRSVLAFHWLIKQYSSLIG